MCQHIDLAVIMTLGERFSNHLSTVELRMSPLQRRRSSIHSISERPQNGRRALNWAAINNRVDAVRFFLAHRAVIEAMNLTGYTALHHAAEHGSLEAARVLLAAGANPKRANLEGVTPAARARQEGFIARRKAETL